MNNTSDYAFSIAHFLHYDLHLGLGAERREPPAASRSTRVSIEHRSRCDIQIIGSQPADQNAYKGADDYMLDSDINFSSLSS